LNKVEKEVKGKVSDMKDEGKIVLSKWGRRGKVKILVKCPKCGNTWEYTGYKTFGEWIACPKCHNRFAVRPDTVLEVYTPELKKQLAEYLGSTKRPTKGAAKMLIKCPYCSHVWKYGGGKTFGEHISCPACHGIMKINADIVLGAYTPELKKQLAELRKGARGLPHVGIEDMDKPHVEVETLERQRQTSRKALSHGRTPRRVKPSKTPLLEGPDRIEAILRRVGVPYSDVFAVLVRDGAINVSDPYILWKSLKAFQVAKRDIVPILSYFYMVNPGEIASRLEEWYEMEKSEERKKTQAVQAVGRPAGGLTEIVKEKAFSEEEFKETLNVVEDALCKTYQYDMPRIVKEFIRKVQVKYCKEGVDSDLLLSVSNKMISSTIDVLLNVLAFEKEVSRFG